MAGKWEGFTEEDIGRYLGNNEEIDQKVVPKRQAANLQGQVRKNVTRERMLTGSRKTSKSEEAKLPEGAALTREIAPLIQSPEDRRGSNVSVSESEETTAEVSGSTPVCIKVIEGNGYEVYNKSPSAVSTATLEVFQARQKLLEEQNKRRKEILSKVLSDRKKQTTEEARRLQTIQEELQKLDLLLSNDVGILRNQIETASYEFAEAQKRYNKAEKEFLDAKHTLFSKLEKKELLTRHLCTIIEQNEVRKAQKLSELMEKLRIEESSEEAKSDLKSVIISPYYASALNDEKGSEVSSEEPSKNEGIVNQGYVTKEPTVLMPS